MTSPDRFDDERWRRLGALFDELSDQPDPARDSRIAQIAASDPELADALAGLLAADRAPAAVLDAPPAWRPAPGSEAPVEPPPERAGVYRIVGRLGRGGQADVYEGVRDDGTFEQRVAVKVLRRGLDTEDLLERFLRERRILARLEHPAIARLLDGGALPDGRPYFVLERVEGVPIHRYAADLGLDVAGRLRLLLVACDAVAYAHRNLVVHRDIKPSNVLVSAGGEVKLLDFGIAKLLAPEPDVEAAPTIRELRLLTPSYAAPEQLAGRPTTTATDVWGLGALAYELLVGEAPYASRAEGRSPPDSPPPRPSARVLALGDDSAAARRRARELRGDLDVVLLRALDLDPSRRYPSVEAFADDLRRHLDGRPVAARPDSLGYRLGKLARRHRVAATVSALAATAVLAAAVVAVRQAGVAARERDRAEHRFEQVRRLAESLLFDLHDRIEHLPGSLDARRALVAEAESYLDALAAEAGDDVRLQRDLAAAYERLGNLAGGSRSAQLGATSDALRHFERARVLRERLADAPDAAPVDVEALADHRLQSGALLRGSGDLAGAASAFRDGIARLTGLERSGRSTRDPRLLLAGLHQRLSEIELRLGNVEAAESSARAAESAASAYVADHPAEAAGRNNLAAALSEMAQALAARGDTTAAMERNGRAIELWDRLRLEDPHNTRYLRALAYSRHAQGQYHSQTGDRRRAVESYRRELEIAEEMVAADPSDRYARLAAGIAESALGGALLESEGPAEGVTALRRGRHRIEQIVTEDPANGFARGALAGSDLALARALIDSPRSHERTEACAALARAASGTPVPDALLSRCTAGQT